MFLESKHTFQDFLNIPQQERHHILLAAIKNSHAYHFTHNLAYRNAVTAKGVGPKVNDRDLTRILRPTSQVFKSYIDTLGTAFPNHKPKEFYEWLRNNLSITLPDFETLPTKQKYRNLEEFLSFLEGCLSADGIEFGTSSGTTGRATIMIHTQLAAEKAAEAYQEAVYSQWGTFNQHHFIFVMPSETRIVMARIARTATARLGLDTQASFTIPFSATPDQVRVRSGQLFEPGFKGYMEQRIMHPFMIWMNENYVKTKYVDLTIQILEDHSRTNGDLLLFGGYVQMHHIYQGLLERGYSPGNKCLPVGNQSIIGTGGGLKEQYPFTPSQIIQDLKSVLCLENGNPVPHRDVYGMAEANWAAAQCEEGNYHLPAWILAVIINQEDQIVDSPQATGLLAFYDPLTDLGLYPHFYKTADRVTLNNGVMNFRKDLNCPCGHSTAYLLNNSISRQDRLDEAGCAGQI